jgi:DNA-binding IclR family transcriptional regulator
MTMADTSAVVDARGPRDQLAKALALLRFIAESSAASWGVRELAQELQMAPSTVHRLLTTLEGHGMIRSESGRYELGLEFFRLAWHAAEQMPLRRFALPQCRLLADRCDETVLLGVCEYSTMETVHIASVDSSNPLRYAIELHQWLPAHANTGGLAILAQLPEEDLERFFRMTRLRPLTTRTPTTRQAVEEILDVTRSRGYAVTHGLHIPDAVGLAAPILAREARPLGYVMLTIPEQRFPTNEQGSLGNLVLQCAADIARSLLGD